ERLLRQRQGTLLYFEVFIGIHQVPVDVLDLAYTNDHLLAKALRTDLLVVLGDVNQAHVNAAAKPLEQMLSESQREVRIERWIGGSANIVARKPRVIQNDGESCSRRVSLVVGEITETLVLVEHRSAGQKRGALRRLGMLNAEVRSQNWIILRNRWSGAGRRADETSRSRSGAAGAGGGSTRARSADARWCGTRASRCVRHHAAVDPQERTAGLGPQDIGVRNRQVVTSDGDVEVVSQGNCDRVVQREHD